MKQFIVTLPDGSTNTIVADEAFVEQHYPGQWALAPEPETAPESAVPTEWLIDVGPFFDRFGPAKMAVLAHPDALVQALVKDLQVRRWIDLERADVGQGIDLLISKGITDMNAARKTAILTTPVAPEENLALRKTYFS